jgi:hypothetical protein
MVASGTIIVYLLIHNSMVGIETTPEAQVAWTKDETEAEAELRTEEIEDEFLTLPKWTHTYPIILTYRTAQLHAETN